MGSWFRAAVALSLSCGRLGFDAAAIDDGALRSDVPPGDTGAPIDAAGPPCTGFICDDFEAAQLGSAWSIATTLGGIALDTAHAHSGSASAHFWTNAISTSATEPEALLSNTTGMPISDRQLYARVWIFVPSAPGLPTDPLMQFVDFSTFGGAGISAGMRHGVFVANDYTSLLYSESATATIPVDTWTCVQFDIPNGGSGATHVAIGGSAIADLTLAKATPQPAADQVYLGLDWVGTVSSFPETDLWIDDVIISAVPTTCDERAQ